MNTPHPAFFAVLVAAWCLSGCETAPQPATQPAATPVVASIPSGVDILDVSRVDRQPIPRSQKPPRYPIELRRRGVSGGAMVEFVVGTDGNVYDATAVRATHPDFGDAAVASLVQWKFQPGMKNGAPVWVRMQVPISFTLNEGR